MINVSIVTYDTPLLDVLNATSTCAKSSVVMTIYIIDNSPKDILRQAVEGIEKVVYIFTPRNPGYGAAHNIGIGHSIAQGMRCHLVLNADVIFDHSILEGMLNYVDINEHVGLIAPKMLYEDRGVQCNRKLLPTPMNMFLRAFFPKNYRSQLDDHFQMASFGYDEAFFVPYISGAFMFFKTSVFKKVGTFDERFFMYPEDIDLSRRTAQEFQVKFVPDFVIIHKYGGATRKSFRMFAIHAVNMCRYFNKWGWFFDKGRRDLNKRTLEQKSLSKFSENL